MDIKIGNKKIMSVTANEIKCLDNDLLSSKDWLVEGLNGKINACYKRMRRQWEDILRKRGLAIPADDDDLITLITSQPDYANRMDRESAKIENEVVNICLVSGKKAKASCPWEVTRVRIFTKGTAPTTECEDH